MKVRLRVPAVDDPDFVVEMAHGEVAVMRLVGSADTAAMEPFAGLLDTIHAELLAHKATEVVLDLRGLDHMAASCLRQLLHWLNIQAEAPEAERYRVRIRVNPTLPWQHGLHALACFDTNTISIET